MPRNGIFKYAIMAKDVNCSTQNDILLPITLTWKYIQDDELVWRLIVDEFTINGSIHLLTTNYF